MKKYKETKLSICVTLLVSAVAIASLTTAAYAFAYKTPTEELTTMCQAINALEGRRDRRLAGAAQAENEQVRERRVDYAELIEEQRFNLINTYNVKADNAVISEVKKVGLPVSINQYIPYSGC